MPFPHLQRWLLVFSLLLLASCTSTSEPTNTTPPEITKLGIVSLEVVARGVIAQASFFSSLEAISAKARNPYETLADQCFVTSQSDQVPDLPSSTPTNSVRLDAGETLTVRNGETPYLELTKDASDPLMNYTSSANGALPESVLTLDIPGQEFPAFTDVSFETAPAFELTAPQNTGTITPDTTFTWTGTSENAVINLQMTQLEPPLSISCFAKDDGTFQFSEAIKTELTNKGFTSGQLLSPSRLAGRYEVRGEAALLLLTTRKTLFN
jgi:hypothetical protein